MGGCGTHVSKAVWLSIANGKVRSVGEMVLN